MKKISLPASILLMICLASNVQNINNTRPDEPQLFIVASAISNVNMHDNKDSTRSKEYYLEKSRRQKEGAWVLLGLGGLGTVIGVIIFPENYGNTWFGDNNKSDDNNSIASIIVTAAGVALMANSIPLFIKSAKNKKRARLAVSYQKTGFGVPPNISKGITGISLSIPLGK